MLYSAFLTTSSFLIRQLVIQMIPLKKETWVASSPRKKNTYLMTLWQCNLENVARNARICNCAPLMMIFSKYWQITSCFLLLCLLQSPFVSNSLEIKDSDQDAKIDTYASILLTFYCFSKNYFSRQTVKGQIVL